MTSIHNIRFGVGEWWALGAAISYAIANVLTRVAAVEGDPLAGTVLRVIPLALFGLLMMALRPQRTAQLLPAHADFVGWRQIALTFFSGLIIAPLAHLWLFLAFRYGGVLVAVPFFSTFPLFGALIAVPFLGESFNRRIGTGIVVSLVGITVLTYGQQVGIPVSDLWPLGAFYGLLTGLVWAVSSNIGSFLLRRRMDIFSLIGITLTMSAVILTTILAVQGRLDSFTSFSQRGYISLFVSGVMLGVAQVCLYRAFELTSVASASTVKVLDVLIATVLATTILGEVLNIPGALGIAVLLIGVVVVQVAKAPAPIAR